MGRRRAPCGSGERHDQHRYWVHSPAYIGTGPELTDCPGWAGRDADAAALADRLDRIARDSLWPLKLPAGIRLECHPSVLSPLRDLYVPDPAGFTPDPAVMTGENAAKPQIPVTVTAGMERGQWRITADDGQIAEGTVHDD